MLMSEKFEVGSIVEGKVIKVKPFGAIVSLDNKRQGLVHISQVADTFVKNIDEHIKENDTVKVKIISIEEETNKISLSIRDALPASEKVINQKSNYKPREQKSNYENRTKNTQGESNNFFQGQSIDFEDKMKDFLKQSNERHAGLNKRTNKR